MMSKKKIISVVLATVSVAFLSCCFTVDSLADIYAKENRADVLYGQGVHSFFGGEYQDAIRLFKQVDQLGSEDPRSYFFLGLAYNRLGNVDLADAALKKAAKLEWDGQAARDYNVSDAIRRIQGNERIFVESYRNKAKADWQKSEKRRQKEMYGKNKTEEQNVLKAVSESFVGSAPFGARSVHPFRTAENKRDEHVIPVDENADNSGENAPNETPASKTATTESKPKLELKPIQSENDSEDSPAKPETKKEDKKDDSQKSEEKKEDSKEKADEDDDPFA